MNIAPVVLSNEAAIEKQIKRLTSTSRLSIIKEGNKHISSVFSTPHIKSGKKLDTLT